MLRPSSNIYYFRMFNNFECALSQTRTHVFMTTLLDHTFNSYSTNRSVTLVP
jgi:hypothetical protein